MTLSAGMGSIRSRTSHSSSTACTWPSPGPRIRSAILRPSRVIATRIVSPFGPRHFETQTPRTAPAVAFRMFHTPRARCAPRDNAQRRRRRGGAVARYRKSPERRKGDESRSRDVRSRLWASSTHPAPPEKRGHSLLLCSPLRKLTRYGLTLCGMNSRICESPDTLRTLPSTR